MSRSDRDLRHLRDTIRRLERRTGRRWTPSQRARRQILARFRARLDRQLDQTS